MSPDLLDARIHAIERQNRLLRRGLYVAFAFGGALLWMGQATPSTPSTPSTLKAQQFLLVDAAGTRRAELSLNKGTARLLFFDKAKRVRLNLTVQDDGQPAILLYDAASRPRSMLSTKADGSQAWVLFDGKQRARATMATRPDGSPLLFFTNEKGKITTMLPRK